jgi:hypothetical protein
VGARVEERAHTLAEVLRFPDADDLLGLQREVVIEREHLA